MLIPTITNDYTFISHTLVDCKSWWNLFFGKTTLESRRFRKWHFGEHTRKRTKFESDRKIVLTKLNPRSFSTTRRRSYRMQEAGSRYTRAIDSEHLNVPQVSAGYFFETHSDYPTPLMRSDRRRMWWSTRNQDFLDVLLLIVYWYYMELWHCSEFGSVSGLQKHTQRVFQPIQIPWKRSAAQQDAHSCSQACTDSLHQRWNQCRLHRRRPNHWISIDSDQWKCFDKMCWSHRCIQNGFNVLPLQQICCRITRTAKKYQFGPCRDCA